MTRVAGYVHHSAAGAATQRQALERAGCEQIFLDTTPLGSPDGLAKLLDVLKTGDTLIVYSLSQLGMPTDLAFALALTFKEEGIRVRSLQDGIDTHRASNPTVERRTTDDAT